MQLLKLSKQDVRSGLQALLLSASAACRKGDDEQSMHYLNVYAGVAGQFNLNYADEGVEDLICKISERRIKVNATDFLPDSNKWVLYDDFCTTYVLGIQWLDAMSKSGKEILYITTRDVNAKNRNRTIMPDAEKYDNVTIDIVPQGSPFDRAQYIYDSIVKFGASKVVMHKAATLSPIQLTLPALPKGVERYVINLSDQTFWIGTKAIDYCLEFRQFGASVSLQRRGLKREQLLMCPFYPADDQNEFTGYPDECTEGKLVIFSGGDYYKTLDDNKTYWKLVKQLLDKHQDIVFLFATKNIPEGDGEIHQFIRDNHFEHRFIYINFRPDIYQVFAHCDIYMGTCPTSGSLMCQLAAINAKPILQFYAKGTPDDETEQAICWNEEFKISFDNEQDFLAEADKLIADTAYRKSQGERLQKAMIQKEQFVEMVIKTLETNKTQWPIRDYPIDYLGLDDRWFYLQKNGYIDAMPYLYGTLGTKNCCRNAKVLFLKKNLNRLMKHIIR